MISLITAALVYFTISALLVRPMTRISRNMLSFGENPEDSSRIITPSGRLDEIGVAERELAQMQRQLTQALFQKTGWRSSGSPSARSVTTCATCWRMRS